MQIGTYGVLACNLLQKASSFKLGKIFTSTKLEQMDTQFQGAIPCCLMNCDFGVEGNKRSRIPEANRLSGRMGIEGITLELT